MKPTRDVRIIWSDHAIDRALERFGPSSDISIPNLKIAKASRYYEEGEEFRVHRGGVIYVCSKNDDGNVVIVTVMSEYSKLSSALFINQNRRRK